MIAFSELQRRIGAVKRAKTMAEVRETLIEMTEILGFSYFGLAEHAELRARRPGFVAMGTFPYPWIDELLERRYYADDPVLVASQRTSRCFRWAEIPDMIALTDRQRRFMRVANEAGLIDGLTVPINVPGSLPASCSFVVGPGQALPEDSLPHAQYVACFAFEAAKRLAGSPGSAVPAQLSSRQIDCVVLVSQGKSDSAAAQLLGISADTVHQHVEAAKRKLGVATRQQLVARALYDGHVTYADILC